MTPVFERNIMRTTVRRIDVGSRLLKGEVVQGAGVAFQWEEWVCPPTALEPRLAPNEVDGTKLPAREQESDSDLALFKACCDPVIARLGLDGSGRGL